jgi:hypothetical protein
MNVVRYLLPNLVIASPLVTEVLARNRGWQYIGKVYRTGEIRNPSTIHDE